MYSKNSFKHFLFEKKIDSKLWDIPHLRNVKCFWTKTISFHLSDGSRSYQLLTTKLRSGKKIEIAIKRKNAILTPLPFLTWKFLKVEHRQHWHLRKNVQLKYTIFKNLTFVLMVFKCWLLIILTGQTLSWIISFLTAYNLKLSLLVWQKALYTHHKKFHYHTLSTFSFN